jgi:8-oxo-dGTP diphosphatase
MVRVADNVLSRDDWTELEREVMVEHRWWPLDELSRTEAMVWPETLRAMIETGLRNRCSAA